MGTDPNVHLKTINELFESGTTIVNIHSGQPGGSAAEGANESGSVASQELRRELPLLVKRAKSGAPTNHC